MELNSKMAEVDLAHGILKNSGKPLHYKELIDQIMAIKPMGGRDLGHIMAGVHTEINLDHRFVHMGQGLWGLKLWSPDFKTATYDDDGELDDR